LRFAVAQSICATTIRPVRSKSAFAGEANAAISGEIIIMRSHECERSSSGAREPIRTADHLRQRDGVQARSRRTGSARRWLVDVTGAATPVARPQADATAVAHGRWIQPDVPARTAIAG
jgi:hypothetical protein